MSLVSRKVEFAHVSMLHTNTFDNTGRFTHLSLGQNDLYLVIWFEMDKFQYLSTLHQDASRYPTCYHTAQGYLPFVAHVLAISY